VGVWCGVWYGMNVGGRNELNWCVLGKLIGVVVRWKKELAYKATVCAQDASEEGAIAA
jgi:hypothetical protein